MLRIHDYLLITHNPHHGTELGDAEPRRLTHAPPKRNYNHPNRHRSRHSSHHPRCPAYQRLDRGRIRGEQETQGSRQDMAN